ncbi:MAG: ATP-dependent zinc metalloprotease FtsH [Candidatus Cloacimonetes bacterium]|nr:ATP-dependent zinc metalloprotease FtsH [Candidatus Cloacimonadota bacterium]
MTSFNSFIRGFIIVIVLVFLISVIRSFLFKRKVKKSPETPVNRDKNVPPSQSGGRSAISFPYLLLIILVAFILYQAYSTSSEKSQKVDYKEFRQMLEQDTVIEAEFDDRDINFTSSGKKYQTMIPFEDPQLIEFLIDKGVKVSSTRPSRWLASLSFLFPFLLIIGFWFFFLRKMGSSNSKAFSFSKSRAKLYEASKTKITFQDVAGVDEAKEELQEIVQFLKDPKRFQRLGGRIPRGVLLIGRPGTGKTLLAKAVSGEAGVPFFSISGSDFVEMFVGVGAARVRDLFEQAKKKAPCIAFIDEIDAVGRHRGTGLGGGHDEREQTLNQLLVEMDGFEPNDSVIIIAATNRPDMLDSALLRPGRFDRQVTVDLPDIKGRTEILRVHSSRVPLGADVHLELIARGTPGFSGADLANIVNEAALIAAGKNKKQIEMIDFEEAKDKLILGKEKKSRLIPEDEKQMIAYHEIGHVLTSVFQEKVEPVHKVSIIPRGFTGGATHYLLTDKSNYSRSYLQQILVSLMGGRVAEEIVFGELTTGAGNDIERCTDIAKKMVCAWGMSDKIGPVTIGKDHGEVYLGKELVARDVYSDETARLVDSEIRSFIHEAHQTALEIMTQHRVLLDILSIELLEKETLGTEEIFGIILYNIDEEEEPIVRKKHDRAKELRFEYNVHPPEGTADPASPQATLGGETRKKKSSFRFPPKQDKEKTDE